MSASAHATVGAFPGAQGLRRHRDGAGLRDGPRLESSAGKAVTRSSGDRCAHPGTLASVVAGELRSKQVLEGGPQPDFTGLEPGVAARLVVRALQLERTLGMGGSDAIALTHYHDMELEKSRYVRTPSIPAEDADGLGD